jgi:hypothetical protein
MTHLSDTCVQSPKSPKSPESEKSKRYDRQLRYCFDYKMNNKTIK